VDAFVVHEPSGFWYALARRILPALPPMVAMCHNVETSHERAMTAAARVGAARPRRALARLRYRIGRAWQSDGAIRLADHVVVLSTRDRDYVTQALGRDGRDVTLMLNGVAGQGSARTEATGTASGDGRGDARVLVVGGWIDVKGSMTLPRLWRRVRAARPQATLTLVGTGVDADRVRADFAAEDRASIAVYPRIDDPARVAAMYTEHDVFLLPSISEGGPLSLLEAMQAGVGIVAARAGGIPDLVREGVDAVLFDPHVPDAGADAVLALLDDRGLRQALGTAARASAAARTWDDAAAVLVHAVASAMATGSTASRGGAGSGRSTLAGSRR
jgi:glycosyltransferase involved in cell wall biosynthesis